MTLPIALMFFGIGIAAVLAGVAVALVDRSERQR